MTGRQTSLRPLWPICQVTKLRALLGVLVICSVSYANATGVQAEGTQTDPDDSGTLSVTVENDLFGAGTDRHFTNGLKVTYTTREHVPSNSEPAAYIAEMLPFWPKGVRARVTYGLGQNIYTPDDISDPNPRPGERPYAGWLYLSSGVIVLSDEGSQSDAFMVELGVVGPASLADETQTRWHEIFDFQEPRGWDNQLENEPGVVLMYEHQQKVWEAPAIGGLSMDLVPNAGFALGNVATYLSGGISFRIGDDLSSDLGPPRIRPSLPGSAYTRHTDGLNWYAFTSLGGRAVARNIFLDGNTFEDSLSVEKKPFVGDIQAGVALQYEDWRMSYTYIMRSQEYDRQSSPDRFGSLSVSTRF